MTFLATPHSWSFDAWHAIGILHEDFQQSSWCFTIPIMFMRFFISSLASWKTFMHWNPMKFLICIDGGSWSWSLFAAFVPYHNFKTSAMKSWGRYCRGSFEGSHVFFHRNINAEGGYHAKRNDNTKNDLSIRFRSRLERSVFPWGPEIVRAQGVAGMNKSIISPNIGVLSTVSLI